MLVFQRLLLGFYWGLLPSANPEHIFVGQNLSNISSFFCLGQVWMGKLTAGQPNPQRTPRSKAYQGLVNHWFPLRRPY